MDWGRSCAADGADDERERMLHDDCATGRRSLTRQRAGRAVRRCRSGCRRSPISRPATSPRPSRPAWHEHLAEVEAIAGNPEPATFENTFVALERAGRCWLVPASLLQPGLVSGHARDAGDRDRVRAAARRPQRPDPAQPGSCSPGSTRCTARWTISEPDRRAGGLVERYHLDFVLAGARLDSAGHAATAGAEPATVQAVHQVPAEPAGLDRGRGAGAHRPSRTRRARRRGDRRRAAEATERGHDGSYLIPLILPTNQPLLSTLRNRDVRRRLYEASVNRAPPGSTTTDRWPSRSRPCAPSARNLLGFATHADAMVADQTAQTSAAVDAMLAQLVEPAVANASAEAAVLTETGRRRRDRAGTMGLGVLLRAGSGATLFGRHRGAAPVFRAGAGAARRGVLRRRSGRTASPSSRAPTWSATTRTCGSGRCATPTAAPIGLYLGDYFAREGKRGGAWMNSFVDQSSLLDHRPVVVNNLNVTKPAAGQPALLTLDEVRTLFHEFGHALHGLFSDVTYPRLSGTNVPRDFVEFPSQVNEMWALWPEVLAQLRAPRRDRRAALRRRGRRHRGRPGCGARASAMPSTWPRPCSTRPGIGSRRTPDRRRGPSFEGDALEKAGLATHLVPPRYRTSYFQHIFAGGYSAGYYSYIWSEVLDADIVEWFRENGGMTRANGDEFRAKLLSVGGSVDAMAAFRDVRGRRGPGPLLGAAAATGAGWTGRPTRLVERRDPCPRRARLDRLPAPGLRQGARPLRGRRRTAAVGGQRPDQRLRPRATDADPGQGTGAHRDERVLVRAAGRRGAESRGGGGRPADSGRGAGPGAAGAATGDGAGRVCRPGLSHRVRVCSTTRRTGAVCGVRAAARAGRVVTAADADLHPGAQGRARRARREHHLRNRCRRPGDELADQLRDTTLALYRRGRRACRGAAA